MADCPVSFERQGASSRLGSKSLISLPAKVHLSVVGGVKRGCGCRESITATGQTCRTVILTAQHPAVQHQEPHTEESSVSASGRTERKNQAASKMAPSDRRRDKSSVPTELGWRKKRGNKSEASRERSLLQANANQQTCAGGCEEAVNDSRLSLPCRAPTVPSSVCRNRHKEVGQRCRELTTRTRLCPSPPDNEMYPEVPSTDPLSVRCALQAHLCCRGTHFSKTSADSELAFGSRLSRPPIDDGREEEGCEGAGQWSALDGLLCQSARTLDKQERRLLPGVAVNEWGA